VNRQATSRAFYKKLPSAGDEKEGSEGKRTVYTTNAIVGVIILFLLTSRGVD
jgi:hypothetical protein